MEVAIHKIDKNLIKLGLEIKPTKTNIMIFNNKKDQENRIVCRLKGKRIGNVRAAKFLGIKMDTKLKFNLYLIETEKRVSKAINVLWFTNRVSWGIEANTALMMYKSFNR